MAPGNQPPTETDETRALFLISSAHLARRPANETTTSTSPNLRGILSKVGHEDYDEDDVLTIRRHPGETADSSERVSTRFDFFHPPRYLDRFQLLSIR